MHGGFYDATPPAGFDGYTGNHIGIGPDVWYTNHHYDTDRVGDPDHHLPRDPHRPGAAAGLLRHLAHLPGELRLELARDAAGRGRPHLLRHRRLRGRLHLPRHARRARLGRKHVRGADARRVRARGHLGAEELGPQPPAARPGPARARPLRRRATATGASARRATRSPATASTASTRSGSTPTATSPTGSRPTTTRASATAGPPRTRTPTYGDGVVTPHASFLAMMHDPMEAYLNLRQDRDRAQGLRPGRLLRRRRDEVRRHRAALPLARPGDDHGFDRQRPRRRRHPSGLQHSRGGAPSAPRHRGGRIRRRPRLSLRQPHPPRPHHPQHLRSTNRSPPARRSPHAARPTHHAGRGRLPRPQRQRGDGSLRGPASRRRGHGSRTFSAGSRWPRRSG